MRKISFLCVCALALQAQVNIPIQWHARGTQQDRPGTLMSGSSTSLNNGSGFRFEYSTVVEPADQASNVQISGGTSGNPQKQLHRYMVDSKNQQYFGYDLNVAPGGIPGHFTVTISPLSLSPSDFGNRMTGGSSGVLSMMPLPTYPPPQDVQDGDTVSLELLESGDGKTKVVDYFRISGVGDNMASTPLTAGEARDYSLDDGLPRFDFEGAKFAVNGQPAGEAGFTGKPGVTLWVSSPNQGRYILSLLPHEGFQKAGTIRDKTISFQSDGQQIEIRSQTYILGGRGAWNLYVMHDSRYVAKSNGIAWGTDRMENLIPKQ